MEERSPATRADCYYARSKSGQGSSRASRPVLWRMLIAQASLYRALLHMRSGDQFDLDFVPLTEFPPSERLMFDWRRPGEQVEEAVALHEPFDVAKKYLSGPLMRIVEKLASRSTAA
jgi:hypothetical protein